MLCDDLVNVNVENGPVGFKEVLNRKALMCYHSSRFSLTSSAVLKLEAMKLSEPEKLDIVKLRIKSNYPIWVEFPYSCRLNARGIVQDGKFPEKIGFLFNSDSEGIACVVSAVWKFKEDFNFSVHDTIIDHTGGDVPENSNIRSMSQFGYCGSLAPHLRIGIEPLSLTYLRSAVESNPVLSVENLIKSDNVEELDWVIKLYKVVYDLVNGTVGHLPVDREKLTETRKKRGLLTLDFSEIVL